MKDNKLTPEEIKKALECCKPGNDEGCLSCPLHNTSLPECNEILFEETINLINRQQAEIENCYKFIEQLKEARNLWEDKSKEQQAEIERLKDMVGQNEGVLPKYEKFLKSEAIKEFAERLKETYRNIPTLWGTVAVKHINNLVKEMVGEE